MTDLFELTPAEFAATKAEARRERHRANLIGRMVTLYGRGPEGATCGHCCYLHRKQFAGVYLKCSLGPQSNGPATDWRARWPACGKFQDRDR